MQYAVLMFTGLKPLAILLGFLTDTMGTLIVSYIAGSLLYASLPPGTATHAASNDIRNGTGVGIAFYVLGTLCSVLGGFVTGAMAPRAEVKNGFVMGMFSSLMVFTEWNSLAAWRMALDAVVTLGATTLGGHLARLLYRPGTLSSPPPRL